ncbi:MAG TPA: methyl-accepting chemotaxis protein [Burkholderiaceae bacterium]|nr:methyl-accepting chemotaxis protein [Burkholderiaceae bacterium]
MTIGRKITIGACAMLLLNVGSGISSFAGLNRLQNDLNYYVERAAKRDAMAAEIRALAAEMGSLERAILIRGMLQDQAGVARHKQEFQAVTGKMEDRLGKMQALTDRGDWRSAIQKVADDVAAAKAAHDRLTGALDAQQADLAIRLYDEQIMPLAARVGESAMRFMQENDTAAETARAETQSRSVLVKWMASVLGLLCVAMGGALVFTVRRSSRDLQVITWEIDMRAAQVADGAAQVSNTSRTLAEGANRQAGSVQTTSESSEELASMTVRNRDNAVSAAALASKEDQDIADANRTLDKMLRSMSEISSASDQISKIIKVIDEIAFQTNILALNAAVEAARAGEQGRGFAVVAAEVRSLAQRSAQAAREIKSLIVDSVSRVESGSTLVYEAGRTMAEIVAQVKRVTDLIGEITSATMEQSAGIGQVNQAVTQLDQMTQQNAALVEQSAAAAQSLNDLADRLGQAATTFKLGHAEARPVVAHA